jgi:CHAT domain-containing protein
MGELELRAARVDAAERAFQRAGSLASQADAPALDIDVASGLAEVRRRRGDLRGAFALLERAMAVAERARGRSGGAVSIQERAFARRDALWSRAVSVLDEMQARTDDPEPSRRAYDVVQRAKARSLLDLLEETANGLRVRADPKYRERATRVIDEIARRSARRETSALAAARTEREIGRLEDELAILEGRMRETDPRWVELRFPRPVGASTLQRDLLGERELLLEFFLGEDASWAWAVTRTSFRMVRLAKRAEVERQARAALPLLADYNLCGSDPTYLVPPIRALSETLLRPVAAELAAATTVTIVPHGILWYVPFEALFAEEPRPGGAFRELPWLVKRVDVEYLPAVSVRARLRSAPAAQRSRPGPPELLVVGDPEPGDSGGLFLRSGYGGASPQRASFATEVEGLARTYRGPVRRREGRRATTSALVEASSRPDRLVHLTAHGVFNERRPRLSGIQLTPVPEAADDGFLTVDEVFALELPCDQVVLSACSTALGGEVTGEGLVGLVRAFLYAGARSVVASLWEVPSEATTRLMVDFYGAVGPAGDRVRALAEAKRAALRASASGPVDGAHPALWAGFVLIGEGRSDR